MPGSTRAVLEYGRKNLLNRTPYCHKIRYGVTGAPVLRHVRGDVHSFDVEPTLIELIYHAARGDQPASVSASVTGWQMHDGERVELEGEVYVYFSDDPDDWPEWLAEEQARHQEAARTLLNCTTEEKSANCGECGHVPASHSEGEDPVSPGVCSECSDGEETHDYLPPRGEGRNP